MSPKNRAASPGVTSEGVKQRKAADAKAAEQEPSGATAQADFAKEEHPKEHRASQPKLTRRASVYALTPDYRWIRPSIAFPLYAGTLLSTMTLCFVLEPTYFQLRLFYSIVAVALLLYRVWYYARKEWVLYFIDLCFVNSILLIGSLWYCTDGRCSKDWLLALFIVAQGPVGGATFPLQTPLTLHHPEAFESFFLHASPMWVAYCVRWRWPEVLGSTVPSVGHLVSVGFFKVYLPWALCYLVFLMVQPLLPDKLAGYETLMDGFIFPASTSEQRLVGKRQGFRSYAPKVILMVVFHAVMSGQGFAAAALSYQHHAVQVVWICCVLGGCLISGARFYYQSANPDYVAPGLSKGFANIALAWCLVLPTYLHCEGKLW
eukprot:TRINITY_DN65985_c0_g1_i1.p1 TRINITY_DN65985_c0_g1~~TRINITY_DN65985_c0_g1_i1.p1  ORF type:complete len:387 (+),score=40.02 TRINITY_DN65985_c0_g1_i1:37-1161(+)